MIGKDETVHISWPHHGQVDNHFAISLLDLVKGFPSVIGSYNSIHGLGLLAKTRNIMVKHFLEETKDDWLLMVDSDEFVSITAFGKLLSAADKDSAAAISGLVFSGGYETRLEPMPCIFKIDKNGLNKPYYDYPEDQLVEIDSAGAGCILVHRNVLNKIKELYEEQTGPTWAWFQDGPIGSSDFWVSEDLTFTARIKEAGYQLYAHTGAILPHHKGLWITDEHYKEYRAKTKDKE